MGDLNQYNQTYTFDDVKARMQEASADGNILVPLIIHSPLTDVSGQSKSLFYNSNQSQSGYGNLFYGS